MFFFPFLCCGIPDLALGILKMLIRVCFRDVLQPAKSLLNFSWHDKLSANLYSKCTAFTVNICYLQVLAMYKKVLS